MCVCVCVKGDNGLIVRRTNQKQQHVVVKQITPTATTTLGFRGQSPCDGASIGSGAVKNSPARESDHRWISAAVLWTDCGALLERLIKIAAARAVRAIEFQVSAAIMTKMMMVDDGQLGEAVDELEFTMRLRRLCFA